MHEGQTLSTGARRRIHMTDGTVLEEVILAYDPPNRHRYGWAGGAKFPFSVLVRAGTGNWEFTEVEGGTQIVWSYTFELTSLLAYPFVLPIVRPFRGWLQQGLDSIRAEILG